MCVDAPGINVTEATQTEMSANASETGDAPNIAPRDDWFLGCLINWANQFNLEQGITLAVGGAIISGQLISGRRYFEEMAAQAMAGTVTGTEDAESLKSTIADWLASNGRKSTTSLMTRPTTTCLPCRGSSICATRFGCMRGENPPRATEVFFGAASSRQLTGSVSAKPVRADAPLI